MQSKDLNDKKMLEELYDKIIINELNEREYLNGMSLELSRTFSAMLENVSILKHNVKSEILLSFVDQIENLIISAKDTIVKEYEQSKLFTK